MRTAKFGAAIVSGLRTVRRHRTADPAFRFLVCLSILVPAFASLAPAQQVSKAERKLVTRVEPEYPPVLKVRQIGGTVRLEVTITPKGTVKSASLLGGNPILAESAITAVKKWIYAPADVVTTTEVSLEFNPYR
ncbi:MAG TPA: energy transducer TonB [Candidatus Acidoferrum sp.]|nr:energy transducer TonB [Candidatus Acidoferrum sp.]